MQHAEVTPRSDQEARRDAQDNGEDSHDRQSYARFRALDCCRTPLFAVPATAAKYDGNWNMVLVTTSGHCGTINIGMAVNGGHISATSGKFVMHKIVLAGRIAGSGQTKINGVARQTIGNGHFTSVKGSGKSNGTGPSGVCSGVWTAIRA
jgi:hypothetical protein